MTNVAVDAFDTFAIQVRKSYAAAVAQNAPLFTTDVPDLFQVYLDSFDDPAERQYHNCSCCRHFLNHYGSLVTIDDEGTAVPAMWNIDEANLPPDFREAAVRMWNAVVHAGITGVFKSSLPVLGTPETGHWRHFAVTQPAAQVFKRGVLTAGQRMAEMREEFRMLQRGLAEFSQQTFDQAVGVLQTETLYRSDKFLGVATRLAALKQAIVSDKAAKDALVWRAVATAPAGFAHVRSSMIGTLLADLQDGLDFASVKRRFDEKMHPLRYQRPQAAPTTGNIAQAEKLVQQLGIEPSLQRRFASFDEVRSRALWVPRQAQPAAGGVFAALKAPALHLQTVKGGGPVTWVKFAEKVLPQAEQVALVVPARQLSLGTITAPEDADAPPIFCWDKAEARNPFSWYRWAGIDPSEFRLPATAAVPVLGVVPTPSTWDGGDLHPGVIVVLQGAKDTAAARAGLGLFPELLRAELRQVRATINAHSARGALRDPGGQLAAGVVVRKELPINLTFRVQAAGLSVDYTVDRWE